MVALRRVRSIGISEAGDISAEKKFYGDGSSASINLQSNPANAAPWKGSPQPQKTAFETCTAVTHTLQLLL